MQRLVDYILSDEFNHRIETAASLLMLLFGAIMVCRIIKFIVELILYPANFH